jgi:hypothetical protein
MTYTDHMDPMNGGRESTVHRSPFMGGPQRMNGDERCGSSVDLRFEVYVGSEGDRVRHEQTLLKN